LVSSRARAPRLLPILLGVALAISAALAPSARAQGAADVLPDVAMPDTTLGKVKPFWVMARSAVVPGWGQVYNHQPLKAIVVVAGEGYLISRIFDELGKQNDAIDRLNTSIPGSPEYDQALADEALHNNKKIDWIWWTAAAHLLQMADAYVDAHFINFDADFGPKDERASSRATPRLTMALQVKF
jgi:hypothetical protein